MSVVFKSESVRTYFWSYFFSKVDDAIDWVYFEWAFVGLGYRMSSQLRIATCMAYFFPSTLAWIFLLIVDSIGANVTLGWITEFLIFDVLLLSGLNVYTRGCSIFLLSGSMQLLSWYMICSKWSLLLEGFLSLKS